MSQENTLTVGSGPMTIRRSLNNIVSALNISQGKAVFNLRESAFVFTSLQKMNEFVNKYEKQEEEKKNDLEIIDPKLTTKQEIPTSKPKLTPKLTPESKLISKTDPIVTLPDINLAEEENVTEIIEI